MRRQELDESPHAGDLELVGMLPAELRRLVIAWRTLEFRVGPGRASEAGLRRGGDSDQVVDEVANKESLRLFRESTRKEISRLADRIDRRVREVKNCRTCGAENSWSDRSCEKCGALFQKSPARTKAAEA